MNKLIDENCDEIESNKVQMDNMNNEKENIEKNDEDTFSVEVDMPLKNIASIDIGYLHFINVTKFPVITDTLRENLTVKRPDELQNQEKIGSANIDKGRRLTKCFFTKQAGNDRNKGIILFLGTGFCIAQKVNHCTVFAVYYSERK